METRKGEKREKSQKKNNVETRDRARRSEKALTNWISAVLEVLYIHDTWDGHNVDAARVCQYQTQL
jgi:hypothetical protein